MDYKNYIKEEYWDAYIQQRDNLSDRLIEAKYNLLFLKMVYERSEVYRNNDTTERFEIRFVIRRIYVTVAWELAIQIKAFTNDDNDCLTVNKFKGNVRNYFIRDEEKKKCCDSLGAISKTPDWRKCKKLVSNISDYRNKIVGHNFLETPQLTFSINDAEVIITQYEKIFNVLNFQDKEYAKRVADLYDEKASFITAYLDAVLPLS